MEAVDYLVYSRLCVTKKWYPVEAPARITSPGAHPRLTELQAGSYVVMDAFHAQLVPGFPAALTVLATVISRQGSRVVLDAGRKAIGSEPDCRSSKAIRPRQQQLPKSICLFMWNRQAR